MGKGRHPACGKVYHTQECAPAAVIACSANNGGAAQIQNCRTPSYMLEGIELD
jgi:hypothetical protein